MILGRRIFCEGVWNRQDCKPMNWIDFIWHKCVESSAVCCLIQSLILRL